MRVYLCEKPDQGRKLAAALGLRSGGQGCFRGNGVAITWGFGHLLEQAPPEAYGEHLKRWDLDTLPILPEQWRHEVKSSARAQFKRVTELLLQAGELVIATDPGREGEAIAREILERCHYQGRVWRLWWAAVDEASIRKALADLRPGALTEPLYHAAQARARADWLVGMNLTRLFTLRAQQAGYQGVLSVGRVQTPTLKLVVDRDLAIQNFRPVSYYPVMVKVQTGRGDFLARWQVPAAVADGEGRCTNETAARQVAQQVQGATARITRANTERKRERAPLPFSLSTLTEEAGRRFGFGAKQVLDLAQSLYEKGLAYYPRTDCEYLPESLLAEVPPVFQGLRSASPEWAALLQSADPACKSEAWNDGKASPEVSEHHAIIPTTMPARLDQLSDNERKLYDLVVRRYLAQFFPDYEYEQTQVALVADGETFTASGRVPVVTGWRATLPTAHAATEASDAGEDNQNGEEASAALPPVSPGEACRIVQAGVERKVTQPPRPYTESTLLKAMKSVANLVADPKLKAILRETSGLGTVATRPDAIEALKERGLVLSNRRKQVTSTEAGRSLIAMLPPAVSDPGTTALWEQALEDIAAGKADWRGFLARQGEWVAAIVSRVKAQIAAGETVAVAVVACPGCGQSLKRWPKGKHGPFWSCSNTACGQTYDDKAGKPVAKAAKPAARPAPAPSAKSPRAAPAAAQAGQACPTCGQGRLIRRTVKTGKNAGKAFLGCSTYPACQHFAWPAATEASA